jgi:hypothetical protein
MLYMYHYTKVKDLSPEDGTMAFSIMTLSVMTLRMSLFVTLNTYNLHFSDEYKTE